MPLCDSSTTSDRPVRGIGESAAPASVEFGNVRPQHDTVPSLERAQLPFPLRDTSTVPREPTTGVGNFESTVVLSPIWLSELKPKQRTVVSASTTQNVAIPVDNAALGILSSLAYFATVTLIPSYSVECQQHASLTG